MRYLFNLVVAFVAVVLGGYSQDPFAAQDEGFQEWPEERPRMRTLILADDLVFEALPNGGYRAYRAGGAR